MEELCCWCESGNLNMQINQLNEKHSFIPCRVKSADLKEKFLFEVFTAFFVSMVKGKSADRH